MITLETVRELALALPEVEEQDHWGRPSFRVRAKIFATLWPAEQRAMLKLPPAEQAALIMLDPATFSAVPGTWGARKYLCPASNRRARRFPGSPENGMARGSPKTSACSQRSGVAIGLSFYAPRSSHVRTSAA